MSHSMILLEKEAMEKERKKEKKKKKKGKEKEKKEALGHESTHKAEQIEKPISVDSFIQLEPHTDRLVSFTH